MRLFTALWPADDAVSALVVALLEGGAPGDGIPAPRGWTAVDPSTWHVTLAFHGEADPGVLARRLDEQAHGRTAPVLRLAGAGAFPDVRWVGVEIDPPEGLAGLLAAAGGNPARFVPHVTLLRRRARPGSDAEPDPPAPWSGHRGPGWTPHEVLLVASEPDRGGARYRVVHRVPLARGSGRLPLDHPW